MALARLAASDSESVAVSAVAMVRSALSGSAIEDALSIYKRRAAGDLLAPDGASAAGKEWTGGIGADGALRLWNNTDSFGAKPMLQRRIDGRHGMLLD